MTDLTPKQQRFVEEYLVDNNGTQAAIRAGYSPKTANEQASDLLAKPNIAAAVAAGRKKLAENAEMSAAKWAELVRNNYDRAMQAEPVRDREGNPTGEYTYQGAVANKALELLGKHYGYLTERVHMTGDVESATVDRLLAMLPVALEVLNKARKR